MFGIQLLESVTLTGIINNVPAPLSYLRNRLVQREEPLFSETVQIGREENPNKTAPFSPPGATALILGGGESNARQFTAPNIRVKSSVNPGDFMFQPALGQNFYVAGGGNGDHLSRMTTLVTRRLEFLDRSIANTEEWMVSRSSFLGVLSYSVPGHDAFIINYGRPAGNTIVLGGTALWSDPASFPPAQFIEAARLSSDSESTPITDVLMSRTAADAFLRNEAIQRLLDNRRIDIGNITFAPAFTEDGTARFLGTILGIRAWEYSRQLDVEGTMTDLIRPGWVEFYSTQSDQVMYYGAIPDLDAVTPQPNGARVLGGTAVGKRFSKSWATTDPSSLWLLVQSRPLPVPRRPGSFVSMQVI